MTEPLTLERAKEVLEVFGPVAQLRSNRIQVVTAREKARDALKAALGPLSCERLIQMSVTDAGEAFELTYHLTGQHRTVISIRVNLPRADPSVPSVHDILLAAGIYERQIHDLFGIVFPGHPNLKRIILNEDWPEKEYPMRKDWKPEKGTFYGGIKEEVK
ncbi:MAG TPA: NADH-quinone oxidoreductase subunit C [Methanomicrobiales archaeon]|nr:NADH-quinone oxidoreductase subunit C [Methanomicrobiales archaeon]